MYPISFCPNPHCQNHSPKARIRGWYIRAGSFTTSRSRRVQRYRCRSCGMRFSGRTFHLDYGTHKRIDYRLLFNLVRSGAGIRDTARILKVAPNTVQNRISRLARQLMAIHALLVAQLSSDENIAADGFLTFTGSQYFPTEITHLVGCRSQFTYFFNAANMRRRGAMKESQKLRRSELEKRFCPAPGELRGQFKSLCDRVLEIMARSPGASLELITDEHQVYSRTLEGDLVLGELVGDGMLKHTRISSRKARTVTNPLFPVNYLDRELRMMSGDHTRESNKFARNLNNLMERLWIRIFDLNYIKPHRINPCVTSSMVSAEVAGIDSSLVRRETGDMFWRRRFLSLSAHHPWLDYRTWLRGWVTPLKGSLTEYVPRYAFQ